MKIISLRPEKDYKLYIKGDNGEEGYFDVSPYLKFEAFSALNDYSEFLKVRNFFYYIEWSCGADLSADTIESLLLKQA